MSSAPDLTRRIVRHERAIIATALIVLVGLAWWFLAMGAGMDGGMTMPEMAPPPFGVLVLMWWLMMVAMMLPSAAPAILLYARVREQRRASGAVVQPWIFTCGYLLAWLAFSLAAAAAQLAIADAAMTVDRRLGSALLIAAGLYQLAPVKSACLDQCRSPAQFLSRHWRPGVRGALRLGLRHGAFCVGCCWVLMLLLFVGGVMNFVWIAALTLIVGIEKLVPRGDLIAKITGVALIAWGVARLAL